MSIELEVIHFDKIANIIFIVIFIEVLHHLEVIV